MTPTPPRPAYAVERIPIDSVQPHPRNPREGDVGAIAASMAEPEGQYQPIAVQRSTGLIVAGNHRWKAAKALGWSDIDAVWLDIDDARAIALLLRDNRTHDLGRNDAAALFDLLREMAASSLLPATAYDRDDLDALLRDLERNGEDPLGRKGNQKVDPDEAPEVVPNPHVARGDLWRLGEHRVMCGDSTDPEDVARLLGDRRVRLIATDPPYGVAYGDIVAGRANQRAGGWQNLKGDTEGSEAALVTGRALAAAHPYAADGCAIFVWSPTGPLAGAFRDAIEGAEVHILKAIVWVKPTLVFGRHEYHWRHESAFYGWFEGNRADFLGDRSETTVWEIDYSPGYKVRNGPAMASGGLGLHPTQKPVELTARAIRNHTRLGDHLYEPFSGSGSALIAAEMEGRVCSAMELEPGYAQVTIERWEAFTGRSAEKEDPDGHADA